MDAKEFLLLINLGATALNFGWTYMEKRSDTTNKRIADLAEKVEQLDKDVSTLQANAENAPSHEDLAKVHEKINGISDDLHQLIGENKSQSDTLRLIQNHIMHKGLGS